MQIRKRTPRTEMESDLIGYKLYPLLQELIEEYDAPELQIDQVMTQFLYISTRVLFEAGEVDFDIALPTDSSVRVREKFNAYLDSEMLDKIEKARTLIDEFDAPANPITAPNPALEGDPKK